MMKTVTYVIDERVVTTVAWIELLKLLIWVVMMTFRLYSQLKRFWSLECLNWNLGASHLREVHWNG
jgi:hypothetical protein